MKHAFLLAGMLALCGAGHARAADVALDDHLCRAEFNDIQLSPSGEYLAMTLPREGATAVPRCARSAWRRAMACRCMAP